LKEGREQGKKGEKKEINYATKKERMYKIKKDNKSNERRIDVTRSEYSKFKWHRKWLIDKQKIQNNMYHYPHDTAHLIYIYKNTCASLLHKMLFHNPHLTLKYLP
jgi:hypothetical protein